MSYNKEEKSIGSSTKERKSVHIWNGTNYSFPKFDRYIMNWARVKWNEELGRTMWENKIPDELFDIPETADEWIDHCKMIHSYNRMADFKTSRILWADPEFWTHEYQRDWLLRQYELLYSHVESCVSGGAETVVVNCGSDNASVQNMREALKKKFGNARAVNLTNRQKLFDLGMPPVDSRNQPTGPACAERTNVIEWMQDLEDEKHELWQICPVKHRATYKYGLESHLVRVVTENIHPTYNEVVRSVYKLHRMRSAGGLEAETLDLHEHSFSDDHLPPWGELKDAVTEQYDVYCRQWGVSGKKLKSDAAGDGDMSQQEASKKLYNLLTNTTAIAARVDECATDVVSDEADFMCAMSPSQDCEIPRDQHVKAAPAIATALLDVEKFIGIDTDSGRSMSTERSDFLYLDTSERAKRSVRVSGAGGGANKVGGVGPMLVYALNIHGKPRAIIDENAVYLEPGPGQPRFRVVGQMRMKEKDLVLIQCFDGDIDVLECKRSSEVIPLAEENGIQVLKTVRSAIDVDAEYNCAEALDAAAREVGSGRAPPVGAQ